MRKSNPGISELGCADEKENPQQEPSEGQHCDFTLYSFDSPTLLVIALSEQLDAWYASVYPIVVDLLGDIGGRELFLIELDGLIFHLLSAPSINHISLARAFSVGPEVRGSYSEPTSPLLLVFLVEQFLSRLASAGACFHLGTFDAFTNEIFPNDPRYLAFRSIIIEHIESHQGELAKIKTWKFENFTDDCKSWTEYVKVHNPMFVLMSDGTDAVALNSQDDGANLALPRAHIPWKLMMLECIKNHINVAILSNIRFQDSSVITSVFNRSGNVGSMDLSNLPRAPISHLAFLPHEELISNAALQKFFETYDGSSSRELVSSTFLVAVASDNASPSIFLLCRAFVLSQVLQTTLSLRQRCLQLNHIDPELKRQGSNFLDAYYTFSYKIFRKEGKLEFRFLADMIDERLFFSVANILVSEGGLERLPASLIAEFKVKWQQTSLLLDDLGIHFAAETHKPFIAHVQFDHNDIHEEVIRRGLGEPKLMSIHSPLFDGFLASLNISAANATDQEDCLSLPDSLKLSLYNHHEARFDAPTNLRMNQRYMSFVQKYANSLTGVKGLYNKNVIVKAHPATSNSRQPRRASGQSKKAKEIIAANVAARTAKDSEKAIEIFGKAKETIRTVSTLEGKLNLVDTVMKQVESLENRQDNVILALHWMRLGVFWDSWASSATSGRGQENMGLAAKVLADVKLITTMESFRPILTEGMEKDFNALAKWLGFGPKGFKDCGAEIEEEATKRAAEKEKIKEKKEKKEKERREKDKKDKKVKGSAKGSPASSAVVADDLFPPLSFPSLDRSQRAKLSVSESIYEFQMRFMGPIMDRSRLAESRKDDRVPFVPDGWQRELLDIIDRNESALICAPTSSGKTYLAYYAMEKILEANDDDIVLYVAPTKALVNQVAAEVYARFKKNYSAGGKGVFGIWTRDYYHNADHCQVLVTVPDMAEIMLLSPMFVKWARRVKRIIFDEVHCIGIDVQARKGIPMHVVSYEHRHAQLTKYLYLPDIAEDGDIVMPKFVPSHPTGIYAHLRDLTGYTFHKNFSQIHPWSLYSRAVVSKGIPKTQHLSSIECFQMFDAIRECIKEDKVEFVVSCSPDHFFQDRTVFVDTKDMLEYQVHLSEKLKELVQRDSEAWTKISRYLQRNVLARMEAVERQSSLDPYDFDFTAKAVIPMLTDLSDRGMLPVICFLLDRYGCEKLAEDVVEFLVRGEQEKRDNNPVYQRKKEESIQRRIQLERRLKSFSERDMEGDEAQQVKDEMFSLFDWERHDRAFSFAGKTDVGPEDLKGAAWKLPERLEGFLIEGLKRGVGIHHAGLPRSYLSTVEALTRSGHLRVVFATGTLAMGVNMPCKTSAFIGDSVFLSSLLYKQASGRAGRRGFDLQGNVIFLGLALRRISRLMIADLPDLTGQFPLTTSLCLRMFLLTWAVGDENRLPARKQQYDAGDLTFVKGTIDGLLSESLYCHGNNKVFEQMQHHLRFSIELLRRMDLLNAKGQLKDLSHLVIQLYYTEPQNLLFVELLRAGVFDRVCENFDEDPNGVVWNLLFVCAHLFSTASVRKSSKGGKVKVHLDPLPADISEVIRSFNLRVLTVYSSYCRVISSVNHVGKPVSLPLSNIVFQDEVAGVGSFDFLPVLGYNARSPFSALSGTADEFESVKDLTFHCHPNIYLNPEIPLFEAWKGESGQLNSYLIDFFQSGDIKVLERHNKISPSTSWQLLKDFSVVLKAIVYALRLHFERDGGLEESCVLKGFQALNEDYEKKFKGITA
ncbi:hypothetical protein HDU97_008594 [Phlyctochytrium planicorne]|nr:hypothetical protein HDU97_008594 [Phlyctochytrium planicorne]